MSDWRGSSRRWHRRWSLLLLPFLAIWLATALGMALVPRSATTAYRLPVVAVDAAEAWPELDTLRAALDARTTPVEIRVRALGPGPVLELLADPWSDASDVLDPSSGSPLAEQSVGWLEWAGLITGETIDASAVQRIDSHSPRYQKLPLPAIAIRAERATLFFDPKTGALRHQATKWHVFEDFLKTVHTLDFTGGARFDRNLLLTAAALVFLVVTGLGVVSVRRLLLLRGAGATWTARSLRIHQGLGLIFAVQVVFAVSSGLAVVWLLYHPAVEGHRHAEPPSQPLDLPKVLVHPRDLEWNHEEPPAEITLAQLFERPVYRLRGSGRQPNRALFDAGTGQPIDLEQLQDSELRQRLAAEVLAAPESIERWQLAEGPQDLDYYFFRGPWPVWKAWYLEPSPGVLTIDAVTGAIHRPKTRRHVWVERFYKTHVVDWTSGVISYRLEPALLLVIAIGWIVLVTGWWFRRKTTRRTRVDSSS